MKTKTWRALEALAAVLLILVAALAAAFGLHWTPVVRAVDAARLVAALAAPEGGGPEPPGRSPRTVSYKIDGRGHLADLYPAQGAGKAWLIVVPGAIATGNRDPRLVRMARTLTAARFTVLIPDIPRVRELRLSAEDRIDVADAVSYAASQKPAADRLGAVGVSYALGPVVLAALDSDVGKTLDFIVGIGGYYDVDAVLTYFTTGYYRSIPGGAWAWRKPNDYGKWLFVLSNVDKLSDSHDAALLSSIARRALDDPAAPYADLASQLGPEGRAVLAFADNKDPERVAALLAAMPQRIRDDIAALDLKTRDLSQLHPRFLLIHGRDDPIIPETESVRLARALPEGGSDLFIVDRLAHVDMRGFDIRSAFSLWRAALRLMQLRDGAA